LAESRKKLSPPELVRRARDQMEELFGKPVESVSGFGHPEDNGGGWTVTLEILELPRIPDTTSLLGTYEVTLDSNGDLTDAKRVRRYPRNQYDPIRQQGEDS
jgi:hypothetical protein